MKPWYAIDNIDEIDSPALVVFPDRVMENIAILKQIVPDTTRLRPHVKTNKSLEVSMLLVEAGITKFKCATIAEAEMLAMAQAQDVLLAYPVNGPKAIRLLALINAFPKTQFSCLIDNLESARQLSSLFLKASQRLSVYIDVNIGMNRTGIAPQDALLLYQDCHALGGIQVIGLHAYDGHIRDTDLAVRTAQCDKAFAPVEALAKSILQDHSGPFTVVAGGTPTFPIHAKRAGVECSPGTFIYWDMGYQRLLPDEPFVFAALVISRVISKPTADTLCIDLGHKSIASENPIDSRVFFLNAPELQAIGHSEEHLVVRTPKASDYRVGDVLFGVPIHICPTVSLHEVAHVVRNGRAEGKWNVLSRKRMITI